MSTNVNRYQVGVNFDWDLLTAGFISCGKPKIIYKNVNEITFGNDDIQIGTLRNIKEESNSAQSIKIKEILRYWSKTWKAVVDKKEVEIGCQEILVAILGQLNEVLTATLEQVIEKVNIKIHYVFVLPSSLNEESFMMFLEATKFVGISSSVHRASDALLNYMMTIKIIEAHNKNFVVAIEDNIGDTCEMVVYEKDADQRYKVKRIVHEKQTNKTFLFFSMSYNYNTCLGIERAANSIKTMNLNSARAFLVSNDQFVDRGRQILKETLEIEKIQSYEIDDILVSAIMYDKETANIAEDIIPPMSSKVNDVRFVRMVCQIGKQILDDIQNQAKLLKELKHSTQKMHDTRLENGWFLEGTKKQTEILFNEIMSEHQSISNVISKSKLLLENY